MAKIPDLDPGVARVFETYPPAIRQKLLAVRRLIFEVAAATDGVGPIAETLKWGEPAYLTEVSKSGSTIRIAWKAATPGRYGMYLNCRTTLVDSFRTLFPAEFRYEGDRAIVFEASDPVPGDALSHCIAMALTYHLNRKSAAKR